MTDPITTPSRGFTSPESLDCFEVRPDNVADDYVWGWLLLRTGFFPDSVDNAPAVIRIPRGSRLHIDLALLNRQHLLGQNKNSRWIAKWNSRRV